MSPVDTAVLALVLAILATVTAFALKSRHRTHGAYAAKRPAMMIPGFRVRDWFISLLGRRERSIGSQ